jgi:nucleotide-binding universal stress UspA family protein
MDELEKDRQLCLADGLKYLDGLKESLRASDVQISVDVACHSPLYESILHKVRDNSPDLVIKTASGSHPMRRIRFDDNDWQLAQLCPVPLMLTQSRPWAASPRFAATVDVSEYEHGSLARRIVHTAHFLANGCDAQLDILYSEREPVSAAKHAERALALSQLASEHDVPPDHIRLLKGEAEEALPRFAAGQDYDVLVLGALTRRRGVAALMGTLTSKLVDSLDSDFVLVKPEDFAA